jgi:2-dehydropantoate 2-reductase
MEGAWPSVAVLGAGAVGCYFGGMLARAGASVTLVGRQPHVEAMTRAGLFLDSIHFREHIPVAAATSVEAVRHAGIILLCVKTPDTEDAARALAPHLGKDAAVISLQNGVDNVERIRAAAHIDALAAVVYVAAEMTAPGCVKHTGRGDLILGDVPGTDLDNPARRRLRADLAALFTRAGVPCRVSPNIQGDLWIKLVLNCAYNAISALGQARYGAMMSHSPSRDVMRKVVEETRAVAEAAGIALPAVDLVETTWKLAQGMPGASSSTAQDIARGRRTEIDALNGYVARRGAELGIATPVNQTLHALVKLLEESTQHAGQGQV